MNYHVISFEKGQSGCGKLIGCLTWNCGFDERLRRKQKEKNVNGE